MYNSTYENHKEENLIKINTPSCIHSLLKRINTLKNLIFPLLLYELFYINFEYYSVNLLPYLDYYKFSLRNHSGTEAKNGLQQIFLKSMIKIDNHPHLINQLLKQPT